MSRRLQFKISQRVYIIGHSTVSLLPPVNMAPVDPQTAYLVFAAVLGGLILIISLFCGGNSKSEYTILFYP